MLVKQLVKYSNAGLIKEIRGSFAPLMLQAGLGFAPFRAGIGKVTDQSKTCGIWWISSYVIELRYRRQTFSPKYQWIAVLKGTFALCSKHWTWTLYKIWCYKTVLLINADSSSLFFFYLCLFIFYFTYWVNSMHTLLGYYLKVSMPVPMTICPAQLTQSYAWGFFVVTLELLPLSKPIQTKSLNLSSKSSKAQTIFTVCHTEW